MNNFEQMSSPRKIDHLSFGMERLLAGKSKAEQIDPSSRQPDPNSLSPHTEMSYPPISLASSLLATTGESSLSQIQRAMGIYSIPHNHQSLINAGLPFRHLQGTLMNPSHQYLQGLYSSHPLFMSLRAPGPFHNPSGLNFHSGLQPHLLAATMGTGKRKKSWTRAVFSHLQRKGLERRFLLQKYITKPDRRQLAASLGLTDAQVKVWFQNRRMKWRHQETKQRRDQERAAAAANINGSTGSIQQPLIGSSPSINPGHTHLEHQMENGDMESPPESPISSDMESDCADSNQVDSSNEEIKVD